MTRYLLDLAFVTATGLALAAVIITLARIGALST